MSFVESKTCDVRHNVHASFESLNADGLAELEQRERPRLALTTLTEPNEFIEHIKRGHELSLDKWVHYFYLYERYFTNVRERARSEGRKVRFLEVGVFRGGSIEMWTKFFGAENLEYYGVDIDPKTKEFEKKFPHAKIFIGDQAKVEFWDEIKGQIEGDLDAFFDDGGHRMDQQIVTFKCMFEKVLPNGGLYFCEDAHTSYWRGWGGQYRGPSTFIEYCKGLVDVVNEHHVNRDQPYVRHDPLSKQIYGIYFHDSVVVVERRVHPVNFTVMSCLFVGCADQ